MLQFNQVKQQQADLFTPSQLFIYYNEQVVLGTVDENSGAMLRDGIKSVAKRGTQAWPHVIARFRTSLTRGAYATVKAAGHPLRTRHPDGGSS